MFSQFVGGERRSVASATAARSGTGIVLLRAAALAATGIVVTLGLAYRTGEPLWNFTRDPAAITSSSIWIGFLSNLGILLWGAAATVCVFAAGLTDNRRARLFLIASAVLTSMLMVDDALMLHERTLPNRFGLPERVVTLGYGVATLAWLACFRREILASRWIVLAAALGGFAASVLSDQILEFASIATFVEDSLKFAAIVLWLAYFSDTARRIVGAPAS